MSLVVDLSLVLHWYEIRLVPVLRLLRIHIASFLILKTKIYLIKLSCNGKVIGISSGA